MCQGNRNGQHKMNTRIAQTARCSKIWVWPTEVSEYSLCPWKVYYKRVLGVHLEASGPQAVGWFEHEAWRRFYSYIKPAKLTQSPEELDEVVSRSTSESLEWALL